jgi:hypothetical protein
MLRQIAVDFFFYWKKNLNGNGRRENQIKKKPNGLGARRLVARKLPLRP